MSMKEADSEFKIGSLVKSHNDNTVTTNDNIDNIGNSKYAEVVLSRIVNGLVHRGFSIKEIQNTLLHYNYTIKNISEKELNRRILDTFLGAINKKDKEGFSLTDKIKDFIDDTSGEFTFRDVCDMLGIYQDRNEKKKASVILGRFVKDNIIERTGKKNGIFRRIDTDLEGIDWMNASDDSVDMWLPFGLHDMVKIHHGNIILIAGEPNSGKTALCFNIIRYNMEKFKTHYFNSEMGASEMKERIKNFNDIVPSAWNFNAYERSGHFEDVLVPGEGNLNVIDFLEIHDEFWQIGGLLKKIHEKLDGAIAVVCLQKDIGRDTGRGGLSTLEKPRLNLALAPGYVKIVKAKTPKVKGDNHNNKITKWDLKDGCWFTYDEKWFRKGEKPKGEKKNG